MTPSDAVLKVAGFSEQSDTGRPSRKRKQFDAWMLLGICVAAGAIVLGVASTGASAAYFFQPTSALIVLGGACGVMLITTPADQLGHALVRLRDLFRPVPNLDRGQVIDEFAAYARMVRSKGLLSIEEQAQRESDRFLREVLLLSLDVGSRQDLQTAVENKIRLNERQGEADAKVLEVAGGFAPTLGVIGTVIGLIDVLRQFSSLSSVTYGVGTAFVSTIYGLALANLVLLPAAQRIRLRVAETFELQEMMMEGGLCLYDAVHPAVVKQRLLCYTRETAKSAPAPAPAQHPANFREPRYDAQILSNPD